MSRHQIDVNYSTTSPLAIWRLSDDSDGTIAVSPGDELWFNFSGNAVVNYMAVLPGSFSKNSPSGSPFANIGGAINKEGSPDEPLVIADQSGSWTFSLTFRTIDADGASSLYFAIFPELEVGSHESAPA